MRISVVTLAGLLCLGGCATPVKTPATAVPAQARPVAVDTKDAHAPRRGPESHAVAAQGEHRLAPPPPPLELPPVTEPDAVVKLDPKSGVFTPEMEARLARVAAEAAKDDRLLIRLESYVPGGGSPALDIGIADTVLRKVRERLLAQGVAPRRMLLGSFGAEHSVARDPHRHWVEIYIVRPGYSSDRP